MQDFLTGMATCGSLGVAAFFFRFWADTRDRFFLLFATAFLTLAVNWLLVAVLHPSTESRPFFYLLRLAAFGMIIVAVIDKNRPRNRRGPA
jgi:hypothetical protein